MKFIKKLFEWTIILLIGFTLGIFVGTDILSPTELFQQENGTETVENPDVSEPSVIEENVIFNPSLRASEDIDYELIENNILHSVNELREELGVAPVQKNDVLKTAANIRASETEEVFSHARPNGTEPFTVLQEEGSVYDYRMVGENLAMATYHQNDEHMAEFLFDGWVDSEGHYETMINPDFEEIGIGVHYDGEILYATQFFGTQR